MAKSTHDKQLDRARARRAEERAERKKATVLVVVLVAVLVVGAIGLGAVLLLRGGGDAEPDPAAAASESALDGDTIDDSGSEAAATGATGATGVTVEPCPAPSGDLPTARTTPFDEQPAVDLADASTVTATLETTCGTVVLTLDAAQAPLTVGNFVALAEDGYYEGVGFHRVIGDFMIQGGDPTGTGSGCVDTACEIRMPGYTFADELALAEQVVGDTGGYPRGTLAMANAGPDTNGSQFFIVQADPSYPLPAAYTVFGEVASGMDVVDRIVVGPAQGDIAIEPVIILSVSIER